MMRATALLALSIVLAGCTATIDLPYDVQPVAASVETEPMTGTGDKADDPALWVHPKDPSRSLVLGTNKDEGLYVYDLQGRETQRLLVGQVNNVDLRDNLAVASNDEVNGLSWFRISPQGEVAHLGNTQVERIEPYGVCLGRVSGRLTAAVTYKDGTLELWGASERQGQVPHVELSRTETLGGQLEGCVFDDLKGRLFVGEEEHGIWSLDLGSNESTPSLVDSIAAGNGLVADVEGLSLYTTSQGGYLIASAQHADRFVLYDRLPPHTPLGAITVAASKDGQVDAVTHTDGLEASAARLPNYPRGVLIVQDDGNPHSGVDQNFKIVDWRAVEAAIARP